MPLLRRTLTLVFAGLLFQGNLAAGVTCPEAHAEPTHPAVATSGTPGADAHEGMGMPMGDGAGSPAHECNELPMDCAAMSACSTPAIAAVPGIVAVAAAPVSAIDTSFADSPTSRSLPPDVPPPRG